MRAIAAAFAGAALSLAPLAPAQAVTVTFGDPGEVTSRAVFAVFGVETFNNRPTGTGQGFTTDFGIPANSPVKITGTYRGVRINGPDQYGGATQTGKAAGVASGERYAVTFSTQGYTLDLHSTVNNVPTPVTYFGYWLSALDGQNRLELLRGGKVVFTFNPADVIARVGPCSGGNPYCGNPLDAAPRRNRGEPYVFVNFFAPEGLDSVRFYQSPASGGYESDNHTVGFFERTEGNPIPVPGALALFGAGLVGLGAALRRKAA